MPTMVGVSAASSSQSHSASPRRVQYIRGLDRLNLFWRGTTLGNVNADSFATGFGRHRAGIVDAYVTVELGHVLVSNRFI